MSEEIKLLDHGSIRLVDFMGSDLAISQAARTSYNAEWRAGKDEGSDARLIEYLWKNKHSTPFESCSVKFEVRAPIFVIRQWHRHRTQSYSEVSARYTELPSDFYVPEPHLIGTQCVKNKQQRVLGEEGTATAQDHDSCSLIEGSCKAAFESYRKLLDRGVPRELARGVLPMNTYTHMFATMNLLNCLKFLMLRNDNHVQHEIRVYAKAMIGLLEPIFPVTMEIFKRTTTKRG